MAAALLAAGVGTVAAQTPSEANKKFGNWAYACRTLKEDGPKRCVLFQNILWWKSGKRILNVSVARRSKDKPFVAAITAPLGILLPAGLVLHVDEKELVRLPLRFCNVNGYQGQFPINASMQKLFMDREKGRVVFRQPNGRPLRVEFSLKGFAEGFTKLSAD